MEFRANLVQLLNLIHDIQHIAAHRAYSHQTVKTSRSCLPRVRSMPPPANSRAAALNPYQSAGLADKTTSPFSSQRIYTVSPSKRKAAGRRTAWLRPLVNSLAVCIAIPSLNIPIKRYINTAAAVRPGHIGRLRARCVFFQVACGRGWLF